MGSRGDLAAVLDTLRIAPDGEGLIGADPVECARVLGVDGVAVSALIGDGTGELLWSTPGVSTELEDLQWTLGEGPGPEVARAGAVSLEPDLTRIPAERWPVLLPRALAAGVRAVFCFPLLLGSACVGTLTLQRAAPGPPAPDTVPDVWIVAHALTGVLVQNTGRLRAFAAGEGADLYRAAVHQAAGMISVQAGIGLPEALVVLRAYAFSHDRAVMEVAEDVLARRVHFRQDEDGPDQSGRRRD
ncbi:ANTAR domain-containing protein [Streptomyces sp. CRN 30]|uniref:ANTAR domain-containing protein n=1 Tax=Streptomyces sp. CRN 30 TaxID=3075613 RepID=UPI002A81B2FF|nr:ANTAR domain-containing protein [Streptomyces sp. CRN 30]